MESDELTKKSDECKRSECKRGISSAQEAIYLMAKEVAKTGEDINDADADSLRQISFDLEDLSEQNLDEHIKAEVLRRLLDAEQIIKRYRFFGCCYQQVESCIKCLSGD